MRRLILLAVLLVVTRGSVECPTTISTGVEYVNDDCNRNPTHYENPFNSLAGQGCRSTELPTQIIGTAGYMCNYPCQTTADCPTDKPLLATAVVKCIMSSNGGGCNPGIGWASGQQIKGSTRSPGYGYCVLMCSGPLTGTCPGTSICQTTLTESCNTLVAPGLESFGICAYQEPVPPVLTHPPGQLNEQATGDRNGNMDFIQWKAMKFA